MVIFFFFFFAPKELIISACILLKRPRVETCFCPLLYNFLSRESEYEVGEPYVASIGLWGRRRRWGVTRGERSLGLLIMLG